MPFPFKYACNRVLYFISLEGIISWISSYISVLGILAVLSDLAGSKLSTKFRLFPGLFMNKKHKY